MTVPSPSDDTNSSDDVYSSVPDTTSEKIETLDVKRFQNSKGDKFGPLPSVPNKYLNIKNTNAHDIKHTSSADEDENNNKAKGDDKHTVNYEKVADDQKVGDPEALFFCHCEDAICRLPNGTKFNPFYLREMRRDVLRKQNIEPCNTGNIARSISPSCSTCSVNSSKMPNCYRCN